MFCTKCGKKLNYDDRFCAKCGQPVREDMEHSYGDMPFSPPFIEEKKREAIESPFERNWEEPVKKPIRAPLELNWNLDGFPTDKPKKTESIDFNWGSVVEERHRKNSEVKIEKIEPENKEEVFKTPWDSISDFRPVSTSGREEVKFSQPDWLPWASAKEESKVDFNMERENPAFEISEGHSTKEAVKSFMDELGDVENLEVRKIKESPEIKPLSRETLGSVPVIDFSSLRGDSKKEAKKIEDLEAELFGNMGKVQTPEATLIMDRASFKKEKFENLEPEAYAVNSSKPEPLESSIDFKSEDIAVVESDAKSPQPKLEELVEDSITKGEETQSDESKKFYTYNQKQDAFQNLLEKERAKLLNLEDNYNKNVANMDYTWVGEVLPNLKKSDVLSENGNSASDVSGEGSIIDKNVVGVAQPPVTIAVDITKNPIETNYKLKPLPINSSVDEAKDVSIPKESSKFAEEEEAGAREGNSLTNTRVSLDNIFLEEEDVEKKHIFGKIVISLLLIILLALGVVFAFRVIQPDGAVAKKSDEVIVKVVDYFRGLINGEEPKEQDVIDEPEINEPLELMNSLVAAYGAEAKTISSVDYDINLIYQDNTDYAFSEIREAPKFVDAKWYETEDGTIVSYADKIIETTVKFYDSWLDNSQSGGNENPSQPSKDNYVGIENLTIGEMRIGKEGFYILNELTYLKTDEAAGTQISEKRYESLYIKISDKSMYVDSHKEEKL